MYAGHALPVTQRHAQNRDGLARPGKIVVHHWCFSLPLAINETDRSTLILRVAHGRDARATSRFPLESNFRNCRIRIGAVVNGSDLQTHPTGPDGADIHLLTIHAIVEAQLP